MSSPWAVARAVFVAYHIVAITLQALPAPAGGMSRTAWKEPTVQGEIASWTERINTWTGRSLTPAEAEDWLWDFATGFMDAREKVLAPFQPYYRYCGTWQSWRMFVAPHRFPARLHIDVREGGTWRPVFEERSEELTWMETELGHDRLRSGIFRYAWPQYRSTWKLFGKYMARRAAEDFPEADAVRLRFFEYRTRSPEEVLADTPVEGEFTDEQIIAFEGLR